RGLRQFRKTRRLRGRLRRIGLRFRLPPRQPPSRALLRMRHLLRGGRRGSAGTTRSRRQRKILMPLVKAKPTPARWRKPHFYWWTLANVVAACLAILSWVLCLHVFGHPEIPRNYEWLKMLGRADPAVGFSLQEAPP